MAQTVSRITSYNVCYTKLLRLLNVRLVGFQRRPRLSNVSLRASKVGDGALRGRLGGFQLAFGRHLATREFGDVPETIQIGTGFRNGRLHLGNTRFGGLYLV